MDISPTSFPTEYETQSFFWKSSDNKQSPLFELASLLKEDSSDNDWSNDKEVSESTNSAASEAAKGVLTPKLEQKKTATPAVIRSPPAAPRPTTMITATATFAAAMRMKQKNPFGVNRVTVWDRYGKYDHKYRPVGTAYTSKEILWTAVSHFRSKPIIGALRMLVQRGGDVLFQCEFGLQEYTSEPLKTATELFNRYYAYSGDVVGGCAAGIVKIKENSFDIIPSTNVYRIRKFKRRLLADSSLTVFPWIKDGATQSKTMDTRKTVFVPYRLVLLLAKPMLTRDAFLIAHAWATNKGSVNWCMNLLNLLRVGMTFSGLENTSAVVQGHIGDAVTASAYLGHMMKTKVLEACLPALAPKPDVVAGSTNPALENLLAKLGEI